MNLLRTALFAAVGAAFATFSTTTATADGLSGGPKSEARPFSWTGFYIGSHLGLAWSNVDNAIVGVLPRYDHDGNGILAGIQIGYNWQTGNIVVGMEADASWSSIMGSAPCPNPAFTCSSNVEWLASLRGRLGVTTFGGKGLLYATGGWGWADVTYKASPVTPGGAKNSVSHDGAVVGGGLEMMATSHMSFRLEYLAYLLDEATFTSSPTVATVKAEPTLQTVIRLGINYKF